MKTWALAGACALGVFTGAPSAAPPRAPDSSSTEHQYRIIGQMRLGLFWVGRQNIGTARMAWRSDGATSVLTLLAGSDPASANDLNRWGYVREEVRADGADMFALRNRDAGASTFDVSCSEMRGGAITSARTSVTLPGVSYRMFDRALDQAATSPQWHQRQISRPAGASAGLLTALQQAMHAEKARPQTFVYDNVLYDLNATGGQVLGPTTIGGRTFDRLVRTTFAIRDRNTGETTTFSVTAAPNGDGGSLPVQIFYQPNFWLRVELRLDDEVDVPADPASDGPTLARIRELCAGAAN